MIKEITMPAGGQTTDMSVAGAWLVKVGDQVQRGDPLLEIETDKATLTVESYTKGTVLALLIQEGKSAAAGTVIAYIGEESDREEAKRRAAGATSFDESKECGEEEREAGSNLAGSCGREEYQPIDKSAPLRYKKEDKGQGRAEEEADSRYSAKDVRAMPNAKYLAKQENVPLKNVAGMVHKTVIKRADVERYLTEERERAKEPDMADMAKESTEVPLTNMRKVIASRMAESARTIPSYQITVKAGMAACIALRQEANRKRQDGKITYNDILFKCIEAALRKYPYINASFKDASIVLHHQVNIGLAVSVESGLVVPVVKNVEKKTISQVASDNRRNIEKAREGKLTPQEMSGGTITLSNLGMYPVIQFSAVINPPESCILAAGAIEDCPVLREGKWVSEPVMCLTASFDHRVVDGAYGAQFMTELKSIIENPAMAIV